MKTEIILVPITANPITKIDLDNLNLDAVFIGGIDQIPTISSYLSDTEFTAIRDWSSGLNKTVIATQAAATKWGRTLTATNTNPNTPTTIGNSTSIFNGPFGKVSSFNQGGSYQAIFNANISSNDVVLAVDQNKERVVLKNASHNDILISDVDILTTNGNVSSGDGISNDNDRLALNLIYTAIPLSACPTTDIDLDGVSNSLDLDADGDGCNDVTEVYGVNNDHDSDGIYGVGTPVVDVDGKVVAADYRTPPDADTNSTADFLQPTLAATSVKTQPSSITIDSKDNASFTVELNTTGSGTAPTFQWQVKEVGTSTFVDLTDDAIHSGVNTTTLTMTNVLYAKNGNLYRLEVDNPSVICTSNFVSDGAKLTVTPEPFVIVDDSQVIVERAIGTVITNILSNDMTGGVAATTSNVSIALVGSLPTGINLNLATGEVTSDATTVPGIYTFDYQLCVLTDPTNCTSVLENGTITITVLLDTDSDLVADINDLDDDNDGILDTIEDATNNDIDSDGIINSLDPDSDNDGCNDANEATGANTDTDGNGMFGAGSPIVDADGKVIAASYATPLDGDANSTLDFLQASKAATGFSTQPKDHITNINKSVTFETIATSSGAGTDVVYQWQVQAGGVGAWANITDNANYSGTTTSLLTVTPTDGTFSGNTYRTVITTPSYVCDTDQTSSQALLLVNSHVINANNDATTLVEQKAATNIVNVITNDVVNHIAVNIADVNVTQGSTSNAGITLNTTTGGINMTAAVTEGIYFLQYQICEKIDPTNCASGSVTIVVQKDTDLDGIPDVTDPDIDNDGNLNGTDSNPYLPVANDVSELVKVGQATEVDLLSNDDFLPGTTTTIASIGGTAVGTIAFDNLTGKLTYTPTLTEAGTDITVIYEVTNSATGVKSSATATLSVDDEADLSLAMVVDNATPNVGDTVVFTITATNGGPSNATDVDVNSKLSDGYTFVSATLSAGTYDAVTGNWFVGAINNGSAPTIAITATVNASGTYTQVAEVAFSDQSDPDSVAGNGSTSEDDYATISTTPTAQVNLITILSIDNTTPNEGNDVTYQIRVTNNGPSDATNVQITSATIPAGITYKSDDSSGDYIHGTGVWTIGSLASGASTTLHIVGTVNSGQAGNTINNTIVTSLTETDPTTTGDVLTVDFTVNQAVLTTTIVVDNGTPNEGDTVKYTITINNGGANAATGIELTSVLPSGITYVSDNGAGAYNSATGIWNPTSIANGGNASLEITTTVNSGTSGSTISNAVTRITTDQSTTNSLPATTADITVKSINLLTTISVDNSTPNVGGTIKYTIDVTNSGTDTATNVSITDILPTGVTYVSDNGGGSYVSGTGIWTVGSLANAASTSLEITATVDGGTAGSHITNTISSITSTEKDATATGDVLSAIISVTSVNLVTVKTVDNSAPDEADTIKYTIHVSNNSASSATNVSLTDLLPTGVTYVSDTPSQGTYISGTGVWTIGSIAANSSVSIEITATVDGGTINTTITNTATTASGDQSDPTTVGDDLSASIFVSDANLVTVLSVNNTTPSEGDLITYTLHVTNNGPLDDTNVSLTNLLPAGVTYQSHTVTTGTYNSGNGLWSIGGIVSGNTETLKIIAKVDVNRGGQTITSTTSAAVGDIPDGSIVGDVYTASIVVNNSSDIVLGKVVDNATPNAGGTINYTISVTNSGPTNVTNLVISDVLPTGLTFVSEFAGTGVWNTGASTWTLATLASGETKNLIIQATVNADQGGNTIINTISNTQDQTDSNATVDDNTASITVTSVDLFAVKTVNNSTPNVGDTVSYSIIVTNKTGSSEATNVSVTDVLPVGITYVSNSATQGTYNTGSGLWSVGNLANGASALLIIDATVNNGTGGTTITNTASTLIADQSDSNTTADVLSAAINVTNTDLVTVKTVNVSSPTEGQDIIYTITVTNNAGNDATGVTLTDRLPTGVTYKSDDSGLYNSTSGEWVIGSLSAGATSTINITASVNSGTGNTTITNTTTAASGDQTDPTTTGDDLSAVVNVVSTNLVTVNSVNVTEANIGDTVTYTITVTNNGPSAASNVALTDLLPTGVTYISDNSGGSYISGTGVWTIGSIANGASTSINILATADASSGGKTITNVVSARAAGSEADPTTANDILSASFNVISHDLETSLTVDKANPNEGDSIVYTLTVTNNGPSDATGVLITDNLPTGVTYSSHSTINGTFNSGAGIWTIGNLAKNSTATITINATVNTNTGGTTIVNTTAAATADYNDPTAGNNTSSASITVGNNTDVVVTNTVNNDSPNVGDIVTFTITATNNGPTAVQNLVVANALPTGLTYGIVTPSNGTWSSPNWTIGSLASGTTETLTITATVDAGTGGQTLTNVVSNTQTQTDSNSTADDFDAEITVTSSNLVTTKTVNNATPNEGGTIVYTISVINNGPNNATGVSLTDILPIGITYVTDDGSGAYNTGSGIWTIGNIANGATAKLNITATVDIATGGTSIVNVTTAASGDQTDLTTSGDDLDASISVTSSELVTTMSVDNSTPNEGDIVTYSITVNNQGPSDATNVNLTSNLPSGVTFDSFVAPAGTAFNQGSGVWIVGNIASHTSKVLLVKAIVNIGTGGTTITNTTTVATGDQSDPNGVPNIVSVDITVSNTSDIVITKTVDNATPNVGDTVTYTITVENKSGAEVNNFVLTDALPNGLTFGTVTASSGTWTSPNWNIAKLSINDPQTLTVNAVIGSGTGGLSLTNTVSHTQTQTDANTTVDDLSETIVITSADLVTILSVDNVTPNEGDTIIYTLEVTNNGNSNATGINLIDNLPTGVTYVSHTATSGVYNTGSGQWNELDLANGSSATLAITTTVNSGTGGTTITNTTSTATGDQSDPTVTGDITSVDINVTSSDLVTVKTVDNATPNEGDTIVYTIQVTNNGASGATNISLTDQLPSGVTYISDDASGDYNNSTGIWTIGSLANGGVKTLNITATVNAGTGVSQTAITNTIIAAKGDQSDPTVVGDVLSVDINVTSTDLVTTKTVDNATPNEGDIIVYTITVVNNGPSNGTNVTLTDQLPAGVTYVSDDGSGAYDNATGIWTIGSFANGITKALKITATVDVGQGGNTITNTTTVAKGNESDPDSSSDSLSAVINVTSSDLITQKTVSTSSVNGNTFEGEVIQYTITVFNNGTSDATNVSLTDNLPVGVTYVNHTSSHGIYNSGSGHWTIGNIANNETVTLTVSVSVDAGQGGNIITNTTSKAVGDQSDPTTVGDDLSAIITVANSADIVLTKVVDNASPNEGDIVTYTITATNKGPALVTNLEITDALPTGLTYGIVTPSVGTWTSPKWTIGTLTSGATATITIQAIVGTGTGGQTLVNTITKTQDQLDSDGTIDDDTESITVTSAELVTTKTANLSFANEGDNVIFTIQVENKGPNDATGINLTDILPAGLTYVSDDSNGTYNPGSGNWFVGSIANGSAKILNLVASVDSGTSGTTLTNTTTAAIGDQSDPNLVSDDLSESITIKSESDIALTKIVDNATPNEGDIITYTITVTNKSGATATNLVVTDALPSGLTYGIVTPSIGNWTAPNWSVGTLAPGVTETITIQALVTAGSQGLTLVNTISNTQDQIDTNVTLDDDTESISVTSSDLEVIKTASNQSPKEGETIIYTISVENKGPSDATGVSLIDVLPAGVTYVGHFANAGTYNQGSGLWTIGAISNGTTTILTINVTVDAGTTHNQITNTTTGLVADQADPDTSNNIGEITITPGSEIDLSLAKKVLGNNITPKVGDIITYEIVIANAGPNLATGIEVKDLLPSGLKFVRYTSSSTYDNITGIWNVGSLVKDDTKILFIDAEVLATGDYNNCTEVIAADQVDSDSSPNNGIDTEDDYACIEIIPENQSDLSITKLVVANNITPDVGDEISFEIRITNNGPVNATGVQVTDLIPSGYTFISDIPAQGSYDPTTGIWMVGEITSGATEELILNVRVNSSGNYENCTSITSLDQIDPDNTNDSACASTTPISIADLEINKRVDETSPLAGTNVIFTITLDNKGPSNGTGVAVTDVLPSGYDYVSSSTSIGTYNEFTGVWNVGTIINGSTETLTITAKVLSTGIWLNKVEVTSVNELDPDSTPNNGDPNEDDYGEAVTVPDIKVTMPETFTPNGDGMNELFVIPNLEVEYPKFKLVIVNRYGYKVYQYQHDGNPNNTPAWWDGRSSGNLNIGSGILPAGTYFFTIHFNDGDRKPQSGWVYLRR